MLRLVIKTKNKYLCVKPVKENKHDTYTKSSKLDIIYKKIVKGSENKAQKLANHHIVNLSSKIYILNGSTWYLLYMFLGYQIPHAQTPRRIIIIADEKLRSYCEFLFFTVAKKKIGIYLYR